MKKLDQYLIKYTKYKWEFLRRNQNYIEEYNAHIKQIKSAASFVKDNNNFCKKWNLSSPLMPIFSYDQYIEHLITLRNRRKQELKDEVSFSNLMDFLDKIEYYEDGILDPHTTMYLSIYPAIPQSAAVRATIDTESGSLKVSISIDLSYSKNRILKEFKAQLDHVKDQYERYCHSYLLYKFCEERKIYRLPLGNDDKKKWNKFYKENRFDISDVRLRICI